MQGGKKEHIISVEVLHVTQCWELSHAPSHIITKVLFPGPSTLFSTKASWSQKEVAAWLAGNTRRGPMLLKGIDKHTFSRSLSLGSSLSYYLLGKQLSGSGVPNLWGPMPDDLRWSWCNYNRNKVHNKCNVLESSPNHSLHPWPVEKLSSTKPFPGAKRVGACWMINWP